MKKLLVAGAGRGDLDASPNIINVLFDLCHTTVKCVFTCTNKLK